MKCVSRWGTRMVAVLLLACLPVQGRTSVLRSWFQDPRPQQPIVQSGDPDDNTGGVTILPARVVVQVSAAAALNTFSLRCFSIDLSQVVRLPALKWPSVRRGAKR